MGFYYTHLKDAFVSLCQNKTQKLENDWTTWKRHTVVEERLSVSPWSRHSSIHWYFVGSFFWSCREKNFKLLTILFDFFREMSNTEISPTTLNSHLSASHQWVITQWPGMKLLDDELTISECEKKTNTIISVWVTLYASLRWFWSLLGR